MLLLLNNILSAVSCCSDPGVDNFTTDYYYLVLGFFFYVYDTSKATYLYNLAIGITYCCCDAFVYSINGCDFIYDGNIADCTGDYTGGWACTDG